MKQMFQKHGSIGRLHSPLGRRSSLMVVVIVVASLCLGCGRNRFPRDPKMVPAGGVVTIDGDPAQYVRVIFATPEDVKKIRSRKIVALYGPSGVTDEKGAFSISSVHKDDGALAGDYLIAFEWVPPGVPADLFEDGVPKPNVLKRFPPKLLPIHEKYASGKPKNDEFKVTLEVGKPQKELKFDLTSK